MAKKDLFNDEVVRVGFKLQTVSTDTTTVGEIIDTQGFESATFHTQTGTVTDGDYLPLIEEGDDAGLSDAAAVADVDLIGTEAGAGYTADTDDDKVSKLGYKGNKRYIRESIVSTNTTVGALLAGTVVLSHPVHAAKTAQKDS